MIETRIQIEGMACEMCEAHVRNVIRTNFPQIKKIRVDHKTGLACAVAPEPLDAETVKTEIEQGGYRVTTVHHVSYSDRGFVTRILAFFR